MGTFLRRKSYDALPALSVRGKALRGSLRTVTVAVTFAMLWFAFVRGSHAVVLFRMLGFNDLAFGVMGAIPFMATFLQPIAGILIERTGLRKYQFIIAGTIHRLMWILVAAVPLLLPIPSTWALGAVLAIIAASHLTASFSHPAWCLWMGDLIPKRIRGRYIATHNRISRLSGIIAIVCLGVLFDAITGPGDPESAADQPLFLWTACAVLAIGGILGAIDILLYLKVREILPKFPEHINGSSVMIEKLPRARGVFGWARSAAGSLMSFVHDRLLVPLENRSFRHYVAFATTVTFAMAMSWTFYMLNAMENLHFGKLGANVLILVISPLCGVLTAKGWGKLIDRWGRKPVLYVGTTGTVLGLVPLLLASSRTPTPGFLITGINYLAALAGGLIGKPDLTWVTSQTPIGAYLVMAVGFLIMGTCGNAVMMVRTAISFSFADGKGGSKYLTACVVLVGIGGALGGLTGGVVAQRLEFLKASPIVMGPLVWNGWHILFLISVGVRIASMGWLRGMSDPGTGRTREMVRMMGANLYGYFAARLLYPLRVFRPGALNRRNGPRRRS